MARSITALEARTGDMVRFRNGQRTISGTVMSRTMDNTKVVLEVFEPGQPDQSYIFGASDHIVLLDR